MLNWPTGQFAQTVFEVGVPARLRGARRADRPKAAQLSAFSVEVKVPVAQSPQVRFVVALPEVSTYLPATQVVRFTHGVADDPSSSQVPSGASDGGAGAALARGPGGAGGATRRGVAGRWRGFVGAGRAAAGAVHSATFGVTVLVPGAQAPQVRSSLALGALVMCVPDGQFVQGLQLAWFASVVNVPVGQPAHTWSVVALPATLDVRAGVAGAKRHTRRGVLAGREASRPRRPRTRCRWSSKPRRRRRCPRRTLRGRLTLGGGVQIVVEGAVLAGDGLGVLTRAVEADFAGGALGAARARLTGHGAVADPPSPLSSPFARGSPAAPGSSEPAVPTLPELPPEDDGSPAAPASAPGAPPAGDHGVAVATSGKNGEGQAGHGEGYDYKAT